MVNVEEVTAVPQGTLLEGPHWDIERQSLYFNDIYGCKILRYDYQVNKVYEAKLEGEEEEYIGFISPIHDSSEEFIVASGPRLFVVQWDGTSTKAKIVRKYIEVDQHLNNTTRFNDGKIDPRGRIFAGTLLSEKVGHLFKTRDGTFFQFIDDKPVVIRKDIMVSNGLTWNESTNKFYYADSGDHSLSQFDYDPETGTVSNEKIVFEVEKKDYYLDGLTIDENGLIYIATFLGGKVIVVDPNEQKIVKEIEIPGANQITSVAFGGPNLDELFVTTAALEKFPEPNGRMFKVTGLGVKGTRMHSAKI